jgi:hypothetical protein
MIVSASRRWKWRSGGGIIPIKARTANPAVPIRSGDAAGPVLGGWNAGEKAHMQGRWVAQMTGGLDLPDCLWPLSITWDKAIPIVGQTRGNRVIHFVCDPAICLSAVPRISAHPKQDHPLRVRCPPGPRPVFAFPSSHTIASSHLPQLGISRICTLHVTTTPACAAQLEGASSMCSVPARARARCTVHLFAERHAF